MKMIITTPDAPEAIGPYSQGVRAGNFLFVSGQLPIDPTSGNIVKGDITSQTRQSLENVRAIITSAGMMLTNIVKVTVFLADMNDFRAMNEVYSTFFTEEPPARAAVEVSRLPKDALVEIEAVAYEE